MKELFGLKLTRKSQQSDEYQALCLTDKRLFDRTLVTKLCERPPVTQAQKLAQKENYALFTLMGMKGNLHHIRSLGTFPTTCRTIEGELNFIIEQIKNSQSDRKRMNEREKEGKLNGSSN